MTKVTLTPFTASDAHPLRAITVKPFQVVFSGYPAEFLDQPEKGCDIHVIRRDDTIVGMFRIDTRFHLAHTFAQANTPGLRSFIVDADRQGEGIGTAATRALRAYVPRHYAHKTALYLTVNHRNPGAIKTYLRGGFIDTGADWQLGAAGPQDILRMQLT